MSSKKKDGTIAQNTILLSGSLYGTHLDSNITGLGFLLKLLLGFDPLGCDTSDIFTFVK